MDARNIGAHLNEQQGIAATNQSGSGTVDGAAIDRCAPGGVEFYSASLIAFRGTDTGGASPATVQYTIQDSADGSTDWQNLLVRDPADVSGTVAVQTTAMATDNSIEVVEFDLSGARRYIRVQAVVTLTGGTSPTLPIAAAVVLGGARHRPA